MADQIQLDTNLETFLIITLAESCQQILILD